MPRYALQRLVHDVLKKLYDKDRDLIIHEPEDTKNVLDEWQKHVGERAISFRFGYYLQRLIDEAPEYQFLRDYNIDSEYNRSGYGKKALPSFANGIYPDLIIHKRVFNDELSDYPAAINNILIIEIKSWWNPETTKDIIKIKEMTNEDGRYRYRAGVLILLDKKKAKLLWFKKGNCDDCYSLAL